MLQAKKSLLLIFLIFLLPPTFAIQITSYLPNTYDNTISLGQQKTFSINAQDNNTINYTWLINNEIIYDEPEISLAEDAFDLKALNFTQDFFIGAQDRYANGFSFNNDGTKLYIIGLYNSKIYQYSMPNPYDLEDLTFEKELYVGNEEPEPSGITFSNDGTYMFTTGQENGLVYQYLLSEPFEIDSASLYQEYDTSNQDGLMLGITFSNAGSKMFTIGADRGKVYQYNLDPAYDIATSDFVKEYSVYIQEAEPSGITFNNDGTIMYIVGQTEIKIYEYYLSSPFDIQTAEYNDETYIGELDQNPYDIEFDPEGGKIFLLGLESNRIYESNLKYLITEKPYNKSSLTINSQELGMGVFNIQAQLTTIEEENETVDWQLTVLNQQTVNYNSGYSGRIVKECVDSWKCEPWSECINGKQTKQCEYKGSCNREESRFCELFGNCKEDYSVREKECTVQEAIIEKQIREEKTGIGQLLDIIFGIRDNNITKANDLVAESEYISFGSEPARVNITYVIIDENNITRHLETAQIVVETELFVRKEFNDLKLAEGNYKLVMQTLYGNNVRTDFEQNFEVRKKPIRQDEIYWVASLILLALIVVLTNYILLTYNRR